MRPDMNQEVQFIQFCMPEASPVPFFCLPFVRRNPRFSGKLLEGRGERLEASFILITWVTVFISLGQ